MSGTIEHAAQVVHDGESVALEPGPGVRFGRSEDCEVRFGHLPSVDPAVASVAGRVFLCEDRVAVENLSPHIAFDVKEPTGPRETVRPFAVLSPPSPVFEILCDGSALRHVLHVEGWNQLDVLGATGDGKEAQPLAPRLTERQWDVLDAYAAPILAGRTVPATHSQVADTLGWSMSLIRLESGEIWTAFLDAGVPMRDFPDKRDAIVDAYVRHRLRRPDPAGSVRGEGR